ncbi:hypothetical protein [Lentzea sp. NPDC092896]|uniref:hypothetical protein n=1 Tax=Lentzea sp. NPDC092896 TaxID=3364127 RepID=UPI00380FB886
MPKIAFHLPRGHRCLELDHGRQVRRWQTTPVLLWGRGLPLPCLIDRAYQGNQINTSHDCRLKRQSFPSASTRHIYDWGDIVNIDGLRTAEDERQPGTTQRIKQM